MTWQLPIDAAGCFLGLLALLPAHRAISVTLFLLPFSVAVVLVMVFAVCWAPFHIDRLFFSFVVDWTEPLANVFNLIHVLSGSSFLSGLLACGLVALGVNSMWRDWFILCRPPVRELVTNILRIKYYSLVMFFTIFISF